MASSYDFGMIYPELKAIDGDHEFQKRFELGPLKSGFGTTIGNALRRVTLSSLPGGAVKQISIKGVLHEYDVLPIIVEDIVSVVLASKELNIRIDSQDEEYVLELRGNKKGELTAGDITCPPGVEVINKDLKIVTLTEDADFYMEFVVSKGIGYVLAEENRGKEKKANVIFVDSIFTPVINFAYHVEDVRVGDKTNYDNLVVDIETNGTLTPEEAIAFASNIIKEHMLILENIEEEIKESKIFNEKRSIEEVVEHEEVVEDVTSIETLDISNRAYNGLKRARINTIEELCEKSKKEISALDNIGSKTVDEIEKQLNDLGYSFK